MTTDILIVLGIWLAVVFLIWFFRVVGGAIMDAISCIAVALELRDEWRKDVYERTGVLPGRKPKERKQQ